MAKALGVFYFGIKIYFSFHVLVKKRRGSFVVIRNLAVLDRLGLHDVCLERKCVLEEAAGVDDVAAVLETSIR